MSHSSANWRALVCCGLLVAAAPATAANIWPGFRGTGDSHADAGDLPLSWKEGENIAWTADLGGYGQSSPVVWEDRTFVTSISGNQKEKLLVTCVAMDSGRKLWEKEFSASQTGKSSDYVSRGAPTPVVDAGHVYILFESGDLLALTHAGETTWSRSLTKDYGPIEGNHGLGSSPAQTANAVIVLFEHSGPSYLAAIDKQTGKTLWKQDREPRVSWSSPIVTEGAEGTEILLSSNGVAQAFRAQDGMLLWEVTELKGNTVASPSITADAVLVGSSQPGNNLLIKRGGKGDVTKTHVAWRTDAATSSFGSPLIHAGHAYFVSKAGVAFAVDLVKGETLWSQRLPDSTWASPVAAGDRVYFFCKNGTTLVAAAGDTFEKLAENQLPVDGRLYGVAVAHGGFLLRSGNRLTFVHTPAPAAP